MQALCQSKNALCNSADLQYKYLILNVKLYISNARVLVFGRTHPRPSVVNLTKCAISDTLRRMVQPYA
jgi:hypothetical protein